MLDGDGCDGERIVEEDHDVCSLYEVMVLFSSVNI